MGAAAVSIVVDGAGGDIVETNDRAMLGHAEAGFGQGPDGAEGGHIVEGQDRGEGAFLLDQFLR